ncbi:hypothetical protein SCA6_007221 [Theobroma cacao]
MHGMHSLIRVSKHILSSVVCYLDEAKRAIKANNPALDQMPGTGWDLLAFSPGPWFTRVTSSKFWVRPNFEPK